MRRICGEESVSCHEFWPRLTVVRSPSWCWITITFDRYTGLDKGVHAYIMAAGPRFRSLWETLGKDIECDEFDEDFMIGGASMVSTGPFVLIYIAYAHKARFPSYCDACWCALTVEITEHHSDINHLYL